jgi:spore coat protein SA
MEPFSEFRSGAIAKNVADIMRLDDSRIAVCSAADDAWGFSPDRIILVPELRAYAKIRGRHRLPARLTAMFFRYVFKRLLARISDQDIVWCDNQPYFAAALEKSIHSKNAKLIYHAHDGIASPQVRRALCSFSADAYIFVSKALLQDRSKLLPRMVETYAIHNGADEALFHPLPVGASRHNAVPVVLYVGRLHPEKGVHVLMEAMRILLERKVHAICKVIGSSYTGGSKPTAYVKSLLKHSPPNVRFEGYRLQTEIADEYRAADVFCCPSVWQEPFGKTNIEAMACGTPVVATRVGGIPEIAAEGGIILVEPGSAIELADALQSLIQDQGLRERVAAEGLKSFRKSFTWAAIMKEYQIVVNNL